MSTIEKSPHILWLDEVEEHDYPAAESYLRLLFDDSQVAQQLIELRAAPIGRFKAKDIFRASQLSLIGVSNSHVDKDRKKIRDGVPLSPLLLVRDPRHGLERVMNSVFRCFQCLSQLHWRGRMAICRAIFEES